MQIDKIKRKTVKMLEIPTDTAFELPKTILNGKEELYCEGYKGIRLLSENKIRFSVKNAIITVLGEGLCVKSIDGEDIMITGVIHSVEFV